MQIKSALAFVFVSLTLAGATAARADDPPARVGRLAYAEGTVTFHAAGDTQWSYSTPNYPVTAGLSFWTEPQSRAELQIGSSLLRMDSTAEIDVLRLDATATQIQLEQGTISFHIVHMLPGRTIEVETPHGAVSLTQPGTYRIDAGDANTPTTVAALEGEARFIGPRSYLEIEAGEQVTAVGDPTNYTMGEASTTPFDDWALARDKRERESQSIRYVSPEMTGYQDLDEYGTWQPSPEYGQVWVPQSVPTGWAPYREGHWAWVAPWGWTWIDDAPWGFAPFHYGRWANVNGSWAWVPGQPVEQPVYAPALVAFAGGVSLGINVGWLPLGPREPYYPTYHTSPGYLRNVNNGAVPANINLSFGNRTVINNYANHGAATFVPRSAFVGAQPVGRAAIAAPAGALQAAAATTSLTALKPTAFARAARAAPVNGAAPAALPGPSAAAQAEQRQEIHHAEPGTLATTGKTEVEARPGQAVTEGHPAVAGPTAPVAPAVAGRPAVQNPAERSAAVQAGETKRPNIVAHERIIAPGPSVAPASQKAEVPLRQEQLSRALATPATQSATQPASAQEAERHKAAEQAAAQQQQAQRSQAAAQQAATVRNQAAAQQQAVAQQAERAQAAQQQAAKAAAAQASFVHAEVPKPVQSAPLRPTPAGWNRQAPQAPKPPEPKADAKGDEHKDKDEKK